jgi:glycosyltransferase involved in cell wall biosynthesis
MDMFDGDFIQRQAHAVAALYTVDVIHLVQNRNILKITKPGIEKRVNDGINSSVFFINNKSQLLQSDNTVLFNIRYHRKLLSVLKEYIAQNGKPDLVHVQVPVKIGAGAIWLKQQYGIPFIVSEHSNVYHSDVREGINNASVYFKRLTRRVISKADALVTVSAFLGNAILEHACNRPYQVIPNVVNTSLFFYKEHSQPNKRFRFLHVSNLLPVKNPRLMLDAIADVIKTTSAVEFVFAGNATDEWKKYAESIGLTEDVVNFKGLLSYEQVAIEMQKADAFFIFSKSETFSCATAEALCCGLPVAAARVGALPELLNFSNAVFSENANDADSFAHALVQLKNNYQHFNRKEIAKYAASKYNYQVVAQQYDALYKSIINK